MKNGLKFKKVGIGKNLNKLFIMLKSEEPIKLNKTERERLRNALVWAADAINDARYEAHFRAVHDGWGPEHALALQID
jgi:hypothetical protein